MKAISWTDDEGTCSNSECKIEDGLNDEKGRTSREAARLVRQAISSHRYTGYNRYVMILMHT